jgi:class 3 adenylate cyclase
MRLGMLRHASEATMRRPETRYAKAGDAYIAYQVVGDGSTDVVMLTQWFSHVDGQWHVPPLAAFLERLASFSHVVVFDKRGTGLSDPVAISSLPSIEQWMDDLRAVMDHNGLERAAIVANLASAFVAAVFAATFPERVTALVLVNAYARFCWAPDYPWGYQAETTTQGLDQVSAEWGTGMLAKQWAPSIVGDPALLDAVARYERQAGSPGTAVATIGMLYQTDIRSVLPTITAPTLVIARGDLAEREPKHASYVADHIPGARYVSLPGRDALMWSGDQDALVAEIQEFLTGMRPIIEPDRVLATILFTDIVGSTERAAMLGDRAWRELLERHNDAIHQELARFRGREVDTAGDGVLAIFDGPGRAVRCARAAVERVRALGLEIRTGLHTGEVDLVDDNVGGIAVHIGARIAAIAGAGEVLVSSTVRDLVAGSGIEFEDRGMHQLKGVPDAWRILAVVAG